MNEHHIPVLMKRIEQKEQTLAVRAATIHSLNQLQNKDRIELQRLLDLLEETQQTCSVPKNKDQS